MPSPHPLHDFFDEVYVINLDHRTDRMRQFEEVLDKNGWPFKQPIRVSAVPGGNGTVPCPARFTEGGGAFGCRQSHVGILQSCLMRGVGSVLVLEDDAFTLSSFVADCERFFGLLPSDWEGVMLGGQHHGQATKIRDGLVKVNNAQRTQAYAARGNYLRGLYQRWVDATVHIDWLMKDWQHQFKVYAPERWLIGQARSQSDICGRANATTFWQQGDYESPIVLLRAPLNVMQRLRDLYSWHTGYSRGSDDIDQGLAEVARMKGAERQQKLAAWLQTVVNECGQQEDLLCTVWHEGITLQELRQASLRPVIEITASTTNEAISQLPEDSCGRFQTNPTGERVLLLRAPRAVVEELRKQGFHSGNWRDEITGRDNGLRCIFEIEPPGPQRMEKLVRWFGALRAEATQMGGVVTVWHPQATVAEIEAAGETVVEIEAETVEEIVRKWQAAN